MNKICQIIGLLTLTTTAAMSNSYGGAFVGGGIGVGGMRAEGKYTDAVQGEGKTNFNKFGAAYQLHGGYLTEIGTSKTMVGGEIYLSGSSAKKASNIGVDGGAVAGSLNLKRSVGYGFAVIAGKLVNPKVMVYGRVGYEMSRYNIDLNLTGGVQPQSIKKTFSGVVPGAGIDYKVAPNVLVGVEYNYAGLFGNKVVYEQGNQKVEVNPTEHRLLVKASFMMDVFSK